MACTQAGAKSCATRFVTSLSSPSSSYVPSIKGSIPDKDVKPLLDFIALAREKVKRMDSDEMIACLLAVQID